MFVKDSKSSQPIDRSVIVDSFHQIISTFSEIKTYKQMTRFLLARLLYNDGLITIFAFGGIYASGTFGFTFNEIFLFGIILNITAGLGAFLLGFLDDILGGKTTIQISNIGLIVACVLAVTTHNKNIFWFSGVLIGIFAGPNQAASRSLMARFIPKEKESEFFGFFAFSGKATAFVGPLLLGVLTEYFQSQRAGIAVVIILIGLGFIILSKVNEQQAIE